MRPILVAVNAQESRDRLVEILAHAGYSVTQADSAKRALEISCNSLPVLILMAIVMPDLNGLEIAAKLRQILKSDSPPIILLGSIPPIGLNEEPLMSLVNGYLNIDVSAKSLLAAVRSQLSSKAQ